MAFAGCSSWKDFVARTGYAGTRPPGLVLAVAHPGEDRVAGELVWLDGGSARRLFVPREGEPEAGWELPPIEVAESLAQRAVDWRMGGLDHLPGWTDPAHPAECLRAAQAIASSVGARLDFAATVTYGEWEDRHERWLAVYDDLDAALDHARAAALASDADAPDEDGNCALGTYRVRCVPRRRGIPDALVPWARGERLPPERPTRDEEEGGDWTVTVPGRGAVTFTGVGSRAFSAAFLAGLPLARICDRDRCHAMDLGPLRSFAEKGGGAFELAWGRGPMRGEARVSASGADADALLAAALESTRLAGHGGVPGDVTRAEPARSQGKY
jgi:hypothetical protein